VRSLTPRPSPSSLRVAVLRRLYRIAWRGVQLRHLLIPGSARGVKCVLTHRERVLLVRHTYGQRATWYLPGGGVHRRESPLRAAEREMQEELGVTDLSWRELANWDMRLERISVNITALHAELADPARVRPDPVEIAEVRWFARTELPRLRGSEVELLIARASREHDD
jgi:8-oxo-dGTP pyrophosphatase MutT (NUDIX family)